VQPGELRAAARVTNERNMTKLQQWLAGARRRWRTPPPSGPSRATEEDGALRLALLEDRILYSAAPLAPDAPVEDGPAEGDDLSAFDDAEVFATLPEDEPLTLADDDAAAPTRELVVIDRAVENYQQLVHDLTAGAEGRQFDLLYLDAGIDGVDAITRALDGQTIYDSLHLVSHGKPGAVKLGAVWLESGNLAGYAGDLVQWRSGLADCADLLIYGCDLAADHAGRSLVEALSELTGADAAASDDDTGHASRGGDWELEYVVGDVETSVAFSLMVQAEWTGELAASTPGTLVWRASGDSTPNYSEWDGVALAPENDTANVGSWRIIEGAEAPTRDEIILVGVDGSGLITGQIWNGSSWSGLPFNDLATVSTSTYHGFDVAYENQSGDAILVWNNGAGGAAPLSYRVWDGAAWSGEQTIAAPAAGEAYEIRLAASPVSDEMVLIVSNASADEYALVWNGSSWGNGVVLDTGNPGQRTEIAVAYEAQSGQALVVYDAIFGGGGMNYRTWDGASWSAAGTINQPAGANSSNDPRFAMLASDATSDRIVVGVVSGGASNETWFAVWDGNAWGSHLLATSSGANSNVMNAAAAFESQSGTLYVAYGETSNVVQYRTWTSGGGWSGAVAGPNLGARPNSMVGYSDPAQDHLILVVQDNANDLHLVDYFTATEFETSSGETSLQPFVFLFDRLAPPVITMPGGAVDYAENDPATVIDPAATVSDSDSPDFDGGALTVDFSAGGTADDRLEIRDQGAGAGLVSVSGADVQYDFGAGAVTVGTFAGGTDGSTPLVITFNANATPGAVQAVLRNVAFRNVSDDPATAARTVRFSLTDGDGGVSNTVSETINVTAVNDAPVLTPAGPALTGITEDETNNAGDLVSAIVGASITDPDSGAVEGIAVTGLSSGNGTWQYSLDDGASWSDVGAVADNSALLLRAIDRLRFVPDELNADSASVTYRAWDQTSGAAGTKADATITGGDAAFSTAQDTAAITVTAVNDAPTITSDGGGATASLNVAENTLAVTTVAASDPDLPADTLTYSIGGGADAAHFSIDAASGELTFNAPPDFEAPVNADGDNVYDVTVQVSDGAGGLASQAISVAVTEVNEFDVGPITDADAAGNAVDENAANGTAVGITAFAEDADATNNAIDYSLDDNAGGRFAIDAASGVVTVADGTLLDRESAASHDITVRANGSFSTEPSPSLDVDEFDVGPISDVDASADAVDENGQRHGGA
jgi:hypothetical protein